MKCSKRMCPMQHVSDDSDIKNCPYRTEDVDPQEVVRELCNYIADLVVQKLEEKEKLK